MKWSTITGAMALALGTAFVASAQGTTTSYDPIAERGSFWADKLDPQEMPDTVENEKIIFKGITLTTAQEKAYHQLFLRHEEETPKVYEQYKPDELDEAAQGWLAMRYFVMFREYAGVLTPAQQALFGKNVLEALEKNKRSFGWETGLTKDSLGLERRYSLGMLWLNIPCMMRCNMEKNIDRMLQGITLTTAQETAYHKLIPSHYDAMRKFYMSYTDRLSPEQTKARAAKRQALGEQYVKDYRAVLTPAQQTLFDTHVAEWRAERCKEAIAEWENRKKNDPLMVNDDRPCKDLEK